MLLNSGVREDFWESFGLQGNKTSQSQRKSTLNIHWQNYTKVPTLWSPNVKRQLIGKDPDIGKDWRQGKKWMTEDEMVGWHHQLNRHVFEQALGDDGQGSLVCCSPWGHKESYMTEWMNWTELHLWNALASHNKFTSDMVLPGFWLFSFPGKS